MRQRDAQPVAIDIIERTGEVFADHGEWFGKLADLAAIGFAGGGGGGGRASGVSDPTFAAMVRRDPVAEELREHEADVKHLQEMLLKLAKRRAWVRAKGLPSSEPGPIICENQPCSEPISGRGSDVQREGLCGRCYKHQERHNGLPWPKRYVTAEEAARMVTP